MSLLLLPCTTTLVPSTTTTIPVISTTATTATPVTCTTATKTQSRSQLIYSGQAKKVDWITTYTDVSCYGILANSIWSLGMHASYIIICDQI